MLKNPVASFVLEKRPSLNINSYADGLTSVCEYASFFFLGGGVEIGRAHV